MMQFQVDGNGGASMIGDFTFTDHGAFMTMLKELLAASGRRIVLDLAKLTFVDSAGLGMLLIFRDEAKAAGADLVLHAPQGQVRRMFGVTRFETLFTISD